MEGPTNRRTDGGTEGRTDRPWFAPAYILHKNPDGVSLSSKVEFCLKSIFVFYDIYDKVLLLGCRMDAWSRSNEHRIASSKYYESILFGLLWVDAYEVWKHRECASWMCIVNWLEIGLNPFPTTTFLCSLFRFGAAVVPRGQKLT